MIGSIEEALGVLAPLSHSKMVPQAPVAGATLLCVCGWAAGVTGTARCLRNEQLSSHQILGCGPGPLRAEEFPQDLA